MGAACPFEILDADVYSAQYVDDDDLDHDRGDKVKVATAWIMWFLSTWINLAALVFFRMLDAWMRRRHSTKKTASAPWPTKNDGTQKIKAL